MLHRFSKRCRPFNQNGTERNDKNYGKKTTVPRDGIRNFFFGAYCNRLVYKKWKVISEQKTTKKQGLFTGIILTNTP